MTIAYNFLGFCLASLLYGPLSEIYGRRPLMIIGNAMLLAGAWFCVVSPSIHYLHVARFIQGLGASASAVLVFAMIADIYQGDKAIRLIGIMNSCLSAFMAAAPIIGGFINEAIGFTGSYVLVAGICLLSWLLLLLMLPETKAKLSSPDLAKVIRDYKRLLYSKLFMAASLVPSLLYSAYMAFVACASFLYIKNLGLAVVSYACHQAVIVFSFFITSIFSGRIVKLLRAYKCVMIGTVTYISGSLLLVLFTAILPNKPMLVSLAMVIFCTGFAICYPVIFASSLEIFPEIKGTASSAIMSVRALLCAVLVGLAGYIYNGCFLAVAMLICCVAIICLILTLYLLKTQGFLKE